MALPPITITNKHEVREQLRKHFKADEVKKEGYLCHRCYSKFFVHVENSQADMLTHYARAHKDTGKIPQTLWDNMRMNYERFTR